MPQIDLSAWRENVQGCQIGGRRVNIGESAFPSPCTSCICTNEGVSSHIPFQTVFIFKIIHVFQAQCASLRITDCAQLAREWPRDAILRDDVCSAQCGLVLQSTPSRQLRQSNFQRQRQARFIAQNQFQYSQFQGFKFPDLTQFIHT